MASFYRKGGLHATKFGWKSRNLRLQAGKTARFHAKTRRLQVVFLRGESIAERLADQHDLALFHAERQPHVDDHRPADALRALAVVAFAVHRAGRFHTQTLGVERRRDIADALDRARQIRSQLVDAADKDAALGAEQRRGDAVARAVDVDDLAALAQRVGGG